MKTIRARFTLLTVCAIVMAVSITTAIGIISIRNLGYSYADQMLLLLCETGEKNLNAYFDSVEQAVGTVSTLVEEDLVGIPDDGLEEHVDRMRSVFEKAAAHTNGVLTYYYRIDPEYSKTVKGFWYTKADDFSFAEHEVTDITQYDTSDTGQIVWFTVPKATGKPVWLPPYITDNLGAKVFSYNIPVYKDGRFVGVIGIEIDYSLVAQAVDNITLYDHGYAFINDEEGNLIYHPYIDVPTMTDETRPVVPDQLLSDSKYIRYRYEGREKLGAWLPLDNGMRLNVTVPVSEVNGRWQKMIINILVAAVLLLIIGCLVSRRFAEKLTKPLMELAEATEQVSSGNYAVTLNYDGDDEVGIVTQNFENLANSLQAKLVALAESEQANIAKTAFLSNMSHEIRTPITTILGMNEIISRDCKDKDVLGCSANIRKAGTSLLGIISDILDFTKIEAGKMDIVAEPYALTELIGDLYNMVQFRAEDKGLTLRLEIDQHLPVGLIGDSLRLKQVISNLLTNAVKYTEKGTVTLSLSLAKIEEEMATVYVAVSDTGMGISEEERDRIFETFNRLDGRRTHTIEGVGLGLPICRDLLELMGAELSVESRCGEGSTFSFYLDQAISDPAEVGKFDEAPASRHEDSHWGQFHFVAPEGHILLVDDTPMNLEVIKGLLKPTQMQIDVAHSGAECIEKFAVYPYDLVFLDYRMPQMNGIETLAALKESEPEKAQETPIISLTASAVQGERERMLDAGFTDYLTKPVSISEMEKMLVKYLPEDEVIFTEEDGEEQEPDPLEGLPQEAFAYPWLDAKEGVAYCGNADMYLKAIGFFTATIDDKAAQVEKYLAEGDLQQYIIAVHSLKSTTLSIGMTDFSGKAKALEMAGKNGDMEMIMRETPGFLTEFRGYKAALQTVTEAADREAQ